MNFSASEQEIAAARAYENLHVPALFREFAPLVAAAARVGPGQRVLDVACGTGVLTRELASIVGDKGFVAGLDATPGMLAVASELAPALEWKQGLAGSLPYEDRAFDAVVSQFGLMFFPDKLQALREMLRVLAPGGRLAVAVWESLENSESYPDEVALLDRMAGKQAANALRAPFVLGNKAELEALFVSAGLPAVDINTVHGRARFPSIRSMVEADLRGWLPVMGVELDEELIETILSEAEQVLAQYRTADGSVEFDAPAHIVTAQKP